MKIKTVDLDGAALDWAVAHAVNAREFAHKFYPSRRWDHGGALIEKYNIAVMPELDLWSAYCDDSTAYASTPLAAAMRALVMAKLGNEVEIPDELIQTSEESK